MTVRGAADTIDRYFGIRDAGSTLRLEIVGGLTTFATMSYIIFVQPTILATTGMPFGAVVVSTCLASAAACIFMGLIARYPFAVAPGMGENFLFAFTICSTFPGAMGFSWQAGLLIVLIAGLIFLFLSLFGVREKILLVLPDCLKCAIGPAIGLFIGFVGLQWGGLVKADPFTMVKLGDLHRAIPLLTCGGVLLIVVLMARKIYGSILAGILFTTVVGLLLGLLPRAETPIELSFDTAFQFNAHELLEHWDKALIAIALVFFLDLFDTVGTLVGLGKQAGYIGEDGMLPRAPQAFFCDALGSCLGGILGTSTLTTYVESATGIAAGARTGFAAVVTGVGFLFALLLTPFIQIAGQDVGAAYMGVGPDAPHVSMYPAVAPALIVVGFLMMVPLKRIQWNDVTEGMPAFFTMAFMIFGYGITEGIAMGVISYSLIKPLAGRSREVHPVLYLIAAALLARYAFLI